MSRTPYLKSAEEASQACHKVLETILYPRLHKTLTTGESQLINNLHDKCDLQEGIDYTVNEPNRTVTYQERSRHCLYAKYQQVTICCANHNSGTKSEFDKCKADRFVFSYYDTDKEGKYIITETLVIVDAPAFFQLIRDKKIPCDEKYNPSRNQTFRAYSFVDILAAMPTKTVLHVNWSTGNVVKN